MKVLRTLLLVLAVCVSTYAGDMETGRTGEMECDKTGWMETGKTNIIYPVTATAFQLLQSLLPLF